MDVNEAINQALLLKEVRMLSLPIEQGGLGISLDELKRKLADVSSAAIREVATAYPWDFALKSTSTTSVNGTAEYTLEGEDKDCLDIYGIQYGSEATPLDRKTVASIRRLIGRRDINSVKYWVPYGRVNRFPHVKIVGTPGKSGETIAYDYWTKDVGISDLPSVCDWFLVICLAKRVAPALSMAIYQSAKNNAIASYERGGGDTDIVEADPHIVAMNNKISTLHGYGG